MTTTTANVYDTANQLLETRSNTTTGTLLAANVFDANGSMTKKCEGGTVTRTATNCTGTTVTTLNYDSLNRQVLAQKSGLAAETYAYDHEGRRIRKTSGTTTSNYLYQGEDIHAEYGTAYTAPNAVYTHGPATDDPLLRLAGTIGPNATAQYYHQDGIGSVVGVSNSTGATDATRRYSAWGEALGLAAVNSTSLRLTTTPAVQGGTLGLAWSDIANPTPNDWVGMYAVGAPDGNYLDWAYTTGASGGALTLPLSNPTLQPGASYEVRLCANDGFTRLATSASFTLNPTAPTLITTTAASKGSGLGIAWSGIATPTPADWAAVYVPGAPDDNYLDWAYTNGASSGALTLPLSNSTLQPGASYEVRLYANDGYTRLATSAPFTLAGVTTTPDPAGGHYGYTGREPDATGLVYYRARYYDPGQRRFTQRDPIGFGGGINQYAYVQNNPINFNDPNGLLARDVSNAWTQGVSYFDAGTNSFSAGAQSFAASFNQVLFSPVTVLDSIISPDDQIGLMMAAGPVVGESFALARNALTAIKDFSIAAKGGSLAAKLASTELSVIRYTQEGEKFLRYESANTAFSRITSSGGVTPGTFAAPASDGMVPLMQRAGMYNLPNPEILRPNVFKLQPPAGTPVIGPRSVVGGPGNEVIFPFGY